MEKTELTNEQLYALREFANIEGRTWKSVLRQAWMNGDYGIHGEISNSLQQIRNSFGPSWLVRFRLPEEPLTDHAFNPHPHHPAACVVCGKPAANWRHQPKVVACHE